MANDARLTGVYISRPLPTLPLSCVADADTPEKRVQSVRSAYPDLFGITLPKGTIIQKKPDNEAVSEGVGFGGIIFASSNDKESQAVYWQIYHGRKAYFLKSSGVMAWQVDKSGRKINFDSASDGDQDWLASELIALNKLKGGQWQLPAGMTLADFEAEIQEDLAAFWKAHVKGKKGRLVFLSSDGKWAQRGDGREIYYPSYPDPYFLRTFAVFDKSHDWTKLAEDVQAVNQEVLSHHKALGAVGQNPMPAKVFVSVRTGGKIVVENYYSISRNEGVREPDLKDNEMDSIRFLLRMARAAILDKDAAASKMLTQLLRIAQVTTPNTAHILAKAKGAPSPFGWNNTIARASYGIARLGTGDAQAEAFFCSVFNNYGNNYFGEWDGATDYYYDQSLILQILDLYALKPLLADSFPVLLMPVQPPPPPSVAVVPAPPAPIPVPVQLDGINLSKPAQGMIILSNGVYSYTALKEPNPSFTVDFPTPQATLGHTSLIFSIRGELAAYGRNQLTATVYDSGTETIKTPIGLMPDFDTVTIPLGTLQNVARITFGFDPTPPTPVTCEIRVKELHLE